MRVPRHDGSAVARDTHGAIDRLFPDDVGDELPEAGVGSDLPATGWKPVRTDRTGYIESLETDGLLGYAERSRAIVRMERSIGEFVIDGDVLASVWSEKPPEESPLPALFSIGRHRTVE